MIRIIKKSIFFLHLFLISNIFADSNTINIFFPLNDDPILDDISAQSFDEDTSSSFDVTATDLNDDSFTFDCVSANDIFCQVTQSTITLTASGNFNGSQTINVSVSDGNGGQDNQDVVVTVNPINDSPIVDSPQSEATDEDTPVNILLLATDVDQDNLIFTIASNPGNGMANINGNEALYIPNDNYNGLDSFTYSVTDGEFSLNGTVNITINPVNDSPSIINDCH